VLAPPNHRLVTVTVSAPVSDDVDPHPVCVVSAVSSNEPVTGLGGGDLAPDWILSGGLTVQLRAERSDRGNGRTYTLTVRCTDAAGNAATKPVTVQVPRRPYR
jgi:hypothetical protein